MFDRRERRKKNTLTFPYIPYACGRASDRPEGDAHKKIPLDFLLLLFFYILLVLF
jgi:hypothetical protein